MFLEDMMLGRSTAAHANTSSFKRVMAMLLMLALALVITGCGSDDDGKSSSDTKTASDDPAEVSPDGQVKVDLGEDDGKFFIKLDKDTVPAGETTFVIDNVGTMHHELVIYKTDEPADKLPTADDGTAALEEDGIIGEAVYATPLRGKEDHRIRDGRGVNYTIDLEPGKYVLLCNLPGHYAGGQYIAFTVEEADKSVGEGADDASEEKAAPDASVTGTPVKTTLGEDKGKFFIKVDKNTVPAGETTFVIDNVGTMHHELVIYKTDEPADKLPKADDGTAALEEDGIVGEAVYTTPLRGKEDHRIRDGRGVNYTIDLEPGKYVLLCNLPGHYAGGQYIAFTVTG
jgi:uncharacterized cupredoxin-like copper-binding protein